MKNFKPQTTSLEMAEAISELISKNPKLNEITTKYPCPSFNEEHEKIKLLKSQMLSIYNGDEYHVE